LELHAHQRGSRRARALGTTRHPIARSAARVVGRVIGALCASAGLPSTPCSRPSRGSLHSYAPFCRSDLPLRGRSASPKQHRQSFAAFCRSGLPLRGRSASPTEHRQSFAAFCRSGLPLRGRSASPKQHRQSFATFRRSGLPLRGRSASPTEHRQSFAAFCRSGLPLRGRSASPTEHRQSFAAFCRSGLPLRDRSASPAEHRQFGRAIDAIARRLAGLGFEEAGVDGFEELLGGDEGALRGLGDELDQRIGRLAQHLVVALSLDGVDHRWQQAIAK
jgi:hypothetical protein